MPKGLQPKGVMRKNKMLLAAVKLFLKDGYEKTTTAAIARKAGMAPSSFFAAYENKEALLLTLVERMISYHFDASEKFVSKDDDPAMLYAVETALQMHITELSEAIREVYIMAYSLPTTSEYIYHTTAEKWKFVFRNYMPDAQLKDFYETDIASSSIMRGFMAKKCDLYFTIEQKIQRFLHCSLAVYRVPEEQQKKIIEEVLKLDLKPVAGAIITQIVEEAEEGFEDVMTVEKE